MSTVADTALPVNVDPAVTGDGVELQWLLKAVTEIDTNGSDAVLIDRIAALERLKSSCAATQARLTSTFADSITADAAARKHRPDAVRRSIAGQVALARRDSPHAGRRHVGVAAALVKDMPHTLAALTGGDLSERRARTIVEQFACLTAADRFAADQILAPELAGLGDRSAETRAAAIAYTLDPEAAMAKIRGAVKDRHVGLRPAPDTMARLSALLPVSLGVAVYAALTKSADAAAAVPGGDPRGRGQLMADALVSAVTGQRIAGCDDYGVPQYAPQASDASDAPEAADSPAAPDAATEVPHVDATATTEATAAATDDIDTDDIDTYDIDTDGCAVTVQPDLAPATPGDGPAAGPTSATAPDPSTGSTAVRGCTGGCGIGINLIMTDRTLFDGDDEPAQLTGFGAVPAALARALVIGATDAPTRTWVRRLYTDPVTGQLTAMDSARRLFPAAAQRFLLARDQTCRTPWCDAPIRQYDHVRPHADGGPTHIDNGQGLCQACNLTKQAPGWRARPDDGCSAGAILTVPTGHTYSSTPPPPPRSRRWDNFSRLEDRLGQALLSIA